MVAVILDAYSSMANLPTEAVSDVPMLPNEIYVEDDEIELVNVLEDLL